MTVIDASVAVKWYIDETKSTDAIALLEDNQNGLIVPDIFIAEVVGALVRRANIDKQLRRDIETSITRLVSLFEDTTLIARRLDLTQVSKAGTLALDLGHPLKDCLYLALAMDLNCPLITSDTKFAAKARGVWNAVQVLGEVVG